MKVRVAYTITVNDTIRRGIRMFYGKDGLATRSEVKRWYEAYGLSGGDDLVWSVQTRGDDDA